MHTQASLEAQRHLRKTAPDSSFADFEATTLSLFAVSLYNGTVVDGMYLGRIFDDFMFGSNKRGSI